MKNVILKTSILIAVFSIFIIIVTVTCAPNNIDKSFNLIRTENEAKAIADIICKSVYPNVDYDEYEVNVNYSMDDEEWIVSYVPFHDPNVAIVGGGGPEIHIKKSNAEVTSIGLSK